MQAEHSRRDFLKSAAITGGGAGAAVGMLGMFGVSPARAEEYLRNVERGKTLSAAFSNNGLQGTWDAQGHDAALYWAKQLGVNVTWFDGQFDVAKQRAAVDDMASKKWDFVAIQPNSIGSLIQPVKKMIAAGIPVLDMDTLIAPIDSIGVHAVIAPDNIFMGTYAAKALFDSIGGKGNVIETWGQAGHTGAQGRHRGFMATLKQYPNIKVLTSDFGDWDVNKTATLWESYVTKYGSKIDAGFFHNDDMALSAYNVLKRHGMDMKVKIAGIDAMPPAVTAVIQGKMVGTVRNPAGRVHSYALFAGIAAALNGEKTNGDPSKGGIPKNVVVDGPVVTPANGPGLLWMEAHYLS